MAIHVKGLSKVIIGTRPLQQPPQYAITTLHGMTVFLRRPRVPQIVEVAYLPTGCHAAKWESREWERCGRSSNSLSTVAIPSDANNNSATAALRVDLLVHQFLWPVNCHSIGRL